MTGNRFDALAKATGLDPRLAPMLEMFRPVPGSRDAADAEQLRREGERMTRDLAARETAGPNLEAAAALFGSMTDGEREAMRHDLRVIIASIIADRLNLHEPTILAFDTAAAEQVSGGEQ